MHPIIKTSKKVLCTALEQLPRGHLVAASSLVASLLVILALNPEQPLPQESFEVTTQDIITDTELADSLPDTSLLLAKPSNQTLATAINGLAFSDINSILKPEAAVAAKEAKPVKPAMQELTIKSGDNLSSVFARMGLNDRDIYELFDGNKSAKDLRSIAPGQKFEFLVDTQGKLQELKYYKNNLDSLKFTRNETGFTSQQISLKPEVKRTFREGTINSSLFLAGKQAGLPNTLTMELANIFGYDVDFALDIQKGDQFKVLFEEQYLNNKKIGTGAILTAEFTNAGKTYRAVRYTNKDGVTRYYTPDGKGLNKAFLRTPVDFVRISSAFSLSRLHPVLNTIRAHKGTDYAAAIGTPIRATGDGKVIFAGRQGGYGNLIVIQHGQGYETRYGHMNSFAKGISTGSRVSQGQVIGAVGKTGLASGPHLHYEFHVNGQVRNPVTVQLPQSMGIASNEKDRFNSATQTLVAQLQSSERNSRLALGETKTKSN
ncbi:peptidase M23 [Cellvibrio zantedeschiae]|uniref:Peptidase M23 n=1 Tax=Cellvibrio zantedeschiae TaxID=1237077 RepID=A0ABQ3B6X2_9GAMM|nr:peptidoglycan DD-metalloendopeptidase family protein [Cellvibrio zantedeschiae]GGY81201.1 peptidase M23 [Cellvibrio zantedeschiae]